MPLRLDEHGPGQRLRLAVVVNLGAYQEEYLDGVSGTGVPVLFEAGWPRAAIGVVGPSSRIGSQLERIARLALELTAALRPTQTRASQAAL
jgi:DNA-binding IclR family transcriptional regulator